MRRGGGSSESAVLDAVVRILSSSRPAKARELARVLADTGLPIDTHELNSMLYRAGSRRGLEKDAENRWGLRAQNDATGASGATQTTSAHSSTLSTGSATARERDLRVVHGLPFLGSDGDGTFEFVSEWTDEQRCVVELSPGERALVVAGPGTGKTAVACARVAHLLHEGLSPSNILMFSFTRAAVAEVRDRISAVASGGERAAGAVRITTLDSAAWHLNRGLGDQDRDDNVFSSFEESIEAAVELMRGRSDDLLEFMGRMRHVIVDEAQDLVGPRATLVLGMLKTLDRECGFTIFADPAQAIYGFANEDAEEADDEKAFADRLVSDFEGVKRLELKKLHRTKDPQLADVFSASRFVVTGNEPGRNRLDKTRRAISSRVDSLEAALENADLTSDHLVLFRRRSEVLQASSFISSQAEGEKRVHRLRLSAFPQAIHPWIGVLLWDLPESRLTREEFERRASDRLSGLMPSSEVERNWKRLMRFAAAAGGGVVDLRLLRSTLSRPRPPIELCVSETGTAGPILGTIHSSKGRQAKHVVLVLPEVRDGMRPEDAVAEARVVYVGATRARSTLCVRPGLRQRFRRHVTGRVYAMSNGSGTRRVQLELGRETDVLSESAAAQAFIVAEDAALAGQRLLRRGVAHAWAHAELMLCGEDSHYLLQLETPEGNVPIGALSPGFVRELRALTDNAGAGRKVPAFIGNIVVCGVRTVVLSEENPAVASLYEPFRRNGIFLAPVIKGLTFANLPD